jgi:integrase
VTGKGKKERMIPLQPGLDSVLERYLHSCGERHGPDALKDPAAALLVHYDNTPLTRGRVQYVIEHLYRRAGLTAAVPAGALVHALRHSFALLAIEYGTRRSPRACRTDPRLHARMGRRTRAQCVSAKAGAGSAFKPPRAPPTWC